MNINEVNDDDIVCQSWSFRTNEQVSFDSRVSILVYPWLLLKKLI